MTFLHFKSILRNSSVEKMKKMRKVQRKLKYLREKRAREEINLNYVESDEDDAIIQETRKKIEQVSKKIVKAEDRYKNLRGLLQKGVSYKRKTELQNKIDDTLKKIEGWKINRFELERYLEKKNCFGQRG